ncbi:MULTISPECIES: carbamoyltransferase family protein [unclassified Methylophaga]|jgi:carbamoyltransferase|uniref:carbamoyltransferase family protein n=1 Tax=unclassified Methylophaga TaxID=2629249 RepID=UPI000C93BF01|nr:MULTISPECIES: carbamoyltransferase [unclassified Methylophaga]MAK67367.1 carbamoyltransferase [Methylophaga sp.]|tara:strand:+ start:102947 stop:104668 length:1722 start_codon:yes stop_codon:yes gene_type:complete
MIVLGLSGAVNHDASAALYIDGKLVAAAEEERFLRDKHAKGKMAYEATRYCLEQAGIRPDEIDIVAFPYAQIGLQSPARWHYAKRHWYAPDRALTALFSGNRRYWRNHKNVMKLLDDLGIDSKRVKFVPVEHHLAHASSAYHLSGFLEKTAIIGIDGKGEYATTFFGYGENGKIHKIKEFYDPDSLGGVYGAMTEYLGFEMLDGEFKVMGMAPYGDPNRFDFSRLIHCENGEFKVNTKLVNTVGFRRYKKNGKGYFFSPELIEWLGPMREGDEKDEPYIDYAASIQALLEKCALHLIDFYLGDIIRETGKVAYAGGVALNVKLNQRIIAMPGVKELFVQPASSDAGTAIGAASYASQLAGVPVEKMDHVYLGPSYTTQQCIEACERYTQPVSWQYLNDVCADTAKILADGNPVAWFQGRMEFGPRALGNRSILGSPNHSGVADRINAQIKYRERWRPFCPSMLDKVAPEILQTDHPSPYMTFTFDVAESWKSRIPEVVHEDGTARAQIVTRATNARYYELIEEMEKLTGNAVVLNTSLNRRGEPMVCSPTDALNMFYGSDLQYLVMEDILVTK